MRLSYLFLLHQFRIRTVIHNTSTKDRCCKWVVDLLGVDIFELAVQNKFIPFRPQTHCRLLAKQDEGKYIAVLNQEISQRSRNPNACTKDITFSLQLKKNL